MKQLLTIILTISFLTSFSQEFDCTDSLEVTDVMIDNTNLTMNIGIYITAIALIYLCLMLLLQLMQMVILFNKET